MRAPFQQAARLVTSLLALRRGRLGAAIVALTLLAPSSGGAPPQTRGAPASPARSFDARIEHNRGYTAPSPPGRDASLEALRARIPGLAASYSRSTGATRTLRSRRGFLSAARPAAEPMTVALEFVHSHLEQLGLEAADLDDAEVTDEVYSSITGATHVYLRQVYAGLPVYNGQLQINVDADGRVLSVHNAFMPNLATVAGSARPLRSAEAAVADAAEHLGVEPDSPPVVIAAPPSANGVTRLRGESISRVDIDARLMWLPIRSADVRLVWNFQLATLDGQHAYDFTVDARTGQVWTRFDWIADASYRVYPAPIESPNHGVPLPPADARQVVVDPADPRASPFGWHDTNGSPGAEFSIHRGNNVHAYDDLDDVSGTICTSTPSPPAGEPDCGPPLDCDFDFPIDLAAEDPLAYTSGAVTNLFYWNNIIHDIQYVHGFDEAAGNFQVDNFLRGGIGNDDLRAEVQDGGGVNNANFLTLTDGNRPRMQMFLWDRTQPRADGSLDAGIITHEYGHGISTRQVGGPSNVFCLFNNQQPGEGLSDWWALAYTAKEGDVGEMRRGIATYVMGHPSDGDGIRTQPYSTDPTVNTHTYESINGMAIPHGVGEVWAQVAWEAYWTLVEQYGFDADLMNANGVAGNQRMMLYVNEGLKFTGCSPTFTDVRDGIIQAATNLHNGEDVCTLWQAFADFGLGVDAVSGGSNSTSPTNGFKIPANCLPGPRMLSPEPHSVLGGPDESFQWESNGLDITEYELWVGTAEGGKDLYDSGSLGTSQSVEVTGLPEDGSVLFVRVRYRVDGAWGFKDFIYTAARSDPALLLPVPGSDLSGTEVTFEWGSNGTVVTNYWLFVGTTLGGKEIHDSGSLGSGVTSSTVQNLPTDGSTVLVRFWWAVGGLWNFNDYTYTAEDLPSPEIVDPVPGSQLSGSDVVFTWTDDGAPVSLWEILVGSTLGGQEFLNSGPTTASSANVTDLPRDGSTIHVRLRFQIDGGWAFTDFQYTADVGRPKLTAPPMGSVLPGATVTFEWTADGTAVNAWWLYVGSTLGARDIHDSGNLGGALSRVATGIPTDGRDIHVRLWHRIGFVWSTTDYLFTAAMDGGTTPTPGITDPAPGSTLPGPTATFAWSDNGTPVTSWWIYIGTSPGSNNVYDSGNLGLMTSVDVSGLPTDGNDIHLKLWYQTGGVWQSALFQYGTTALTPTIVNPVPNSTLTGTDATFVWEENPDGAPVQDWWVYVGTFLGGSDILSSGALGSAARSVDATGLPTDGRTVYVRLHYRVGFAWSSVDFVYNTASLGGPMMTSPEPGSVLPGSTVNFQWGPDPNGQVPMAWWLHIGSSPGGKDYLDSGHLGTLRSLSVSGLPVDGSSIYVRLWFFLNFKWEFTDFAFTAAGP